MPEQQPYNAEIYESAERCCQCNRRVVRLSPLYDGHWEYYCLVCKALVMTATKAAAAMERLATEHPDAIGLVVAIPLDLPISWNTAPE